MTLIKSGARWPHRVFAFTSALMVAAWTPAIAQSTEESLGSDVDGLRTVARQLSPSLAALALETDGAAAKANGADALDDPTISDSYQYYKDPGLFSAHTVMLSQAFPLWGKRDLRREAALADLDAARGQERAAQDELDERIKVAYAQYYLLRSEMTVNQEISELNRRMKSAASARYAQGSGDQTPVIQALGEETNTKAETIRLEGEESAIRARLNVLIGRSAEDKLAKPLRARAIPVSDPVLSELVDRAHAGNSTLASGNAAIAAAKLRRNLADKSWYPDLTVGGGPLIQSNNQPTGFAVTVGLNVPVPWGRESSGQQQAAAELGAAQQKYDAAVLEIEGALGEAVARLHAARATETLLDQEAMPQARAMFKTVLANYSHGKGELTSSIEAEHQMHDVDLRLLKSQLDEQVELAHIERLIGGDL